MSNQPPRFKDIAKSLNNLLFKEGFDAKGAVKIETKASGVKFNADWEQAGEATKGVVAAEVTRAVPAVKGATAVVSASMNTSGARTAGLTLKGLAPGLELTGAGRYADGDKPNAALIGARYRHTEFVDAEFNVDVLPQDNSPHELTAAASAGAQGFFVGAQTVVALTPAAGKEEAAKKEDYLKAYDFAATYVQKDFEVSANTTKKLDVVEGGFVHHFLPNLDVAAHLKYARKAQETTVTVGAAVKHDDATIKVRLDNKGLLAGSFAAPVRGGATVTLVGQVSTLDSTTRQVGLQVALK